MNKRTAMVGIGVAILTLLFSLSSWASEPPSATYPSLPPLVSSKSSYVLHLVEDPDYRLSFAPDDADDWITIMSEDFEGEFPGDWVAYGNPNYAWGKRDCRAYEGEHSAWCVGENLIGQALRCGASCPTNVFPKMKYGPFSLEGMWDAELRFRYWVDEEFSANAGFSAVCASIGDPDVPCVPLVRQGPEECPDGWCAGYFDLKDAGELGNLCGRPEVWIEFSFWVPSGDFEGLFVDDVLLRAKHGVAPVTPTVTASPTATSGPTSTPTGTPGPMVNSLYLPMVLRTTGSP